MEMEAKEASDMEEETQEEKVNCFFSSESPPLSLSGAIFFLNRGRLELLTKRATSLVA